MLGLTADAGPADVRQARRRLAKRLHPDALVGRPEPDRAAAARRLAEVNWAAALALAELDRPAPPTSPPTPPPHSAAPPFATTGATEATFSVAALPAEAFEVLLLAFSALGDPKVIDEPYLLEGQLDDPGLCLCRLSLVPEAGGSIVEVEVFAFPRAPVDAPSAAVVVGRFVAEVEALGPPPD